MSNQIMTPKEIEITKEVVAAAMLVGEWFANRDAKEWMLCDLASRSWTEQLRAEVKRLTAELAEVHSTFAHINGVTVDQWNKLVADSEALRSQQAGEAVGVTGAMPGTTGFTMACFEAALVPVGTKLYTTPQPSQPSDAYVAKLERLHDAARRVFRTEADAAAHFAAMVSLREAVYIVTDAQQAGEAESEPIEDARDAALREVADNVANNLGEIAGAMPNQRLADMVTEQADLLFDAMQKGGA